MRRPDSSVPAGSVPGIRLVTDVNRLRDVPGGKPTG